jgi:hypothetical protein
MRIRSAVAGTATIMLGASGLAASGLAAQASAAPSSAAVCTGTLAAPELLPPGTYSSLSMPPGSICGVSGDTTITGPLNLGDGSAVGVVVGASLTVTAPVHVGPNAFFGDAFSTSPISVTGPVVVDHNGAVSIGSEQPFGPLTNSIGGPVQGQDASTVQIHNASIGGPVNLQGGGGSNAVLDAVIGPGYNFNDLEDNVISGPVRVNGYSGIWAGVIRNTIDGNLSFTNNSNMDEFDIGSNIVSGNANCSGNDPAVNTGGSPGSPNTVSGHNTCG